LRFAIARPHQAQPEWLGTIANRRSTLLRRIQHPRPALTAGSWPQSRSPGRHRPRDDGPARCDNAGSRGQDGPPDEGPPAPRHRRTGAAGARPTHVVWMAKRSTIPCRRAITRFDTPQLLMRIRGRVPSDALLGSTVTPAGTRESVGFLGAIVGAVTERPHARREGDPSFRRRRMAVGLGPALFERGRFVTKGMVGGTYPAKIRVIHRCSHCRHPYSVRVL